MHLCDAHHNGRALYTACVTAELTAGYYYDMDIVRSRVRTMQSALPENMHLLYSLKANPAPPLLTLLAQERCGADVSSGAELLLALRSGFASETICFVGPGKSSAELTLAVERQIGAVAVESASELHMLRHIATTRRCPTTAIVRINPTYEVRGVRMAMGGRTTQFGLERDEALHCMHDAIHRQSPLQVCGIHIYVGTRIASATDAAWNVGQVIAQARQFGQTGAICTKVDVGGGLGIPYYEDEHECAFESFAEAVQEHVRAYHATGLPPCLFYLESGRYIIGPAGCFFARVQHVAMDGDLQQVEVAATPALHGLSAGSFLAKNRHFLGAGLHRDGWKRGKLPTAVSYRLHGQRLPWPTRVTAPRLAIGDYLVFLNSGAYGPTTSAVWRALEGFPAEWAGSNGCIHMLSPQMTWRTLAKGQQLVTGYA